MPEEMVIDINVFMRAISTTEAGQAESVAFLRRVGLAVKSGEVRLREPPIFVLEFFAAKNRRRPLHDLNLYPEIVSDPMPTEIEPFSEDDAHALQTMHVAAFPIQAPFTTGADLEYLAVAVKHGCTLVSLDNGLLKYGERRGMGAAVPPFCKVIPPMKWLAPGQHAGP